MDYAEAINDQIDRLAFVVLNMFMSPSKDMYRDVAAAPQTPQLGGAQANFGGPN